MLSWFKKKKEKFEVSLPKLPNCTAPFCALFVTDTHGHAANPENGIEHFVSDLEKIDIVFTLGDIEHRDFSIMRNCKKIALAPVFGILGNHDYFSVLEDCQIENLHGNTIEYNGVVFGGMYGSIKYKNVNAPMFTDEESEMTAELLPDCDIFLTHDKAKVQAGNSYNAHGGMIGIGEYIKKRKPAYHFHGHLHENMVEKVFGVESVGFCRYAYVRFDKDGVTVLKKSGADFINL